jgi:sugar transferase (PEP-CTERM/EpsH1 system associated)
MKKILILTPQTPYPPDQGAPIRNYHLIKHLGANPQNQVTLLTFTRLDETPEQQAFARQELEKYCKRVEFVPVPPPRSKITRLRTLLLNPLPDLALRLGSAEFRAKLNQLVSETKFEVVQCEALELAPFVREIFKGYVNRPKLILDNHNAEYLLQYRAYESDRKRGIKGLPLAAYSWLQARRLKEYEAESLNFFDYGITVSEHDRNALLKISPNTKIRVIPNGIDTQEFTPDSALEKPDQLVFTGSMDFRPNVDGMVWFGREVWHLLKQHKPGAKLSIVGRRPLPSVKALAELDGITVTGWVTDARPYMRESCLYIVPIRMGGGVRFKVLEALAMGKPLLTTSMGADGVNLVADKHAVFADTVADFVEKAVILLNNPALRAELARAGREFVVENYDWSKITPLLDEII